MVTFCNPWNIATNAIFVIFKLFAFRSAFRMPTSRSYPRHLVQFREKEKEKKSILPPCNVARVPKGYQGWLRVTKGYQWLPQVTTGYHKLPRVITGYHRLSAQLSARLSARLSAQLFPRLSARLSARLSPRLKWNMWKNMQFFITSILYISVLQTILGIRD